MDVTIPRTAGPASARAETAPLTETSVPQYSHHAILAIWAAAALPMAALAWVVAPAVAARLPGDGALPMAKALLASLTAGLVWQFFLVLILVRREQGTLRWSVMRDALWLRSPRSPRGGRVGGRLWLIVAFGLAGMNEPHGCRGWNDEDHHHHARGRDWPEGRDPAVQRPRHPCDLASCGAAGSGAGLAGPAPLRGPLHWCRLAYPTKRYRSAWIGMVVHGTQSLFFAVHGRPGLKGSLVNAEQIRRFPPARVVALVLIAVTALALVSLRLASGDAPVTVPEGAEAGDLALEPCTYPTEDGPVDADCGTLVVAENPAEADSPLLALPVVRVRARSATPGEPIFFLEGGPGLTNMAFPEASRYVDDRDLVMVGFRGVDGSLRLDCPEVVSAYQRTTDVLGEAFFTARDAALRACAARFAGDGVDPSRYGLVQQIEDLESARAALGYERVNLLSRSAGTRTALVYSWRHPERIHRSVMSGVNPPGGFLWDPATTDEQVRRYGELCAADAACATRTDDLARTMRDLAADPPDRWLLWPIEPANLQTISIVGLTESTSRVMPPDAPATIDAWLSAAEGDPSGLWLVSVLVDQLLPHFSVWGQHLAFASIDADAARDYFAAPPPDGNANFGWAAMASVFAGGRSATAWPTDPVVEEYREPRASPIETLLINGELDFVTAPQNATEELLPLLPNGHEVVLEGVGHNTSFWTIQPEASSRLINTFYDSGTVDTSLYEPHVVDLTPSPTLSTVANVLVGALIALATIMIVTLVAMARRVHRRGAFGPIPSALLRSVYPIVLGLGGWSLGALLVLGSGRPVGLDNPLLAVLGVGTPVGLGIAWAWRRAGTAGAKSVAASVAGALAGAWLGFHAIGGFGGFLTAIVGALLAANLVLLGFDIVHAGVEPRAAPPVAPTPTREPVHT